ncbi:MAG TPA: hypothetical protein VGH13_00170, partial [Xanthobacteraceae bacterium]
VAAALTQPAAQCKAYQVSRNLGRNGGDRAGTPLQFRDANDGRRQSIVINRPHFAPFRRARFFPSFPRKRES